MSSYEDFLTSKIMTAERRGIEVNPDDLHESGKPHQKDIIIWALERGAALVAADCGLGTTLIRAVKKGRKAFGTELHELYVECGNTYLKETEYKKNIPTLFDMVEDKTA